MKKKDKGREPLSAESCREEQVLGSPHLSPLCSTIGWLVNNWLGANIFFPSSTRL